MEKKTFEYENVIVNVHYNHIPGKKELSEACSKFMIDVLRQKEKTDSAKSVEESC